jgi:PAS domain S-box-containing protein
MSWVDILWSMVMAANLTLAAVYGFAWSRRQDAGGHLSFALMAVVAAGLAAAELAMMRAQSPADHAFALRWFQVLVWIGILAVAGFVRFYLRTGRTWLGVAACVLRTLTLVPNFVGAANLNYLEVSRLEQIPFLGEPVAVAIGTPNPWMLLGQVSLVLLVAYVIDASLAAWRHGERRRALVVGGGLACFLAIAVGEAILVFWHLAEMPMATGPVFLVVVAAMGYELRRDLIDAARLTHALEVKDAQLRQSEERLSLAAEAVDAGLWSIDAASGRVWATDKGRELFQLDPQGELHLDHVLARIHPSDRAQVRRQIAQGLQTGEKVRADYRIAGPDGSQRWLVSWGRAYPGRDGEAQTLTGITLDLTERKAMEDETRRQRIELAHLARAATLSELSGALAHELNQPLACILSNAEAGQSLLAQEAPDLTELKGILDDIAGEDRRAADVIRRLRALLRRGEPEPQVLDCNALVEGVLTLLRGDLADRGVTIDLHLSPEVPAVYADRVLLEQVLLNLIANACDAMAATPPLGRRLTIATDPDGEGARITLTDTGPGLPADAGDIFDPFVTTKPQGLGMGLAIARSVAKVHQGRLWAEPNPASGACFHLTLPGATVPR